MTEPIYETAREKWLDNHGGRTEGDVIRDNKGDFIVLWDGKAKCEVKLHLPKVMKKVAGDKSRVQPVDSGDNFQFSEETRKAVLFDSTP